MKAIIQRCSQASVTIDENIHAQIGQGLVVLLGIGKMDDKNDVAYLIRKIVQMRIFQDDANKMNLSLLDVSGDILVISQFTLHANTKKGNRPSFIHAATPEDAIPLYEFFIKEIKNQIHNVKTGIFGADMKVALINDGPVTIFIDSKSKV